MKAMVIRKFGEPSVFELAEIPQPVVKAGHVLVKVLASSVNQIDCKIRSGAVTAVAPEFPAVLNGDVAGIITAVADDVKQFKVGDEVYGCAGGLKGSGGALAEYLLADARLLAHKPRQLSMVQAAALPLVSITAWEALFDRAQLRGQQSVLIHGGAGGVGHIAVQLAKSIDAVITATVADAKQGEIAERFGATNIANFREETVDNYVKRVTADVGFDVVFDTVGGPNLLNSFQATKVNGTVVTTNARITIDLSLMHGKALSLHVVFMLLPILRNQGREHHGKILEKIAKLVEQNKLTPLIDSNQFSFLDIAKAHALLESGKAQGKIVLVSPWCK